MSLLSKTRRKEQSKNALFYPILNSFILNAIQNAVTCTGKTWLENSFETINHFMTNQSSSLNQLSISQYVHALYRLVGYF